MKIVTDLSDWINIFRDDVIRIGGKDYAVRGNMNEPRFGIDDQPKYWVFSAVDLENGDEKIIKTVFTETFYAHIGIFKIKCYRAPEKEGLVLDLVRDDKRFMQGYHYNDEKGNNVRVIDFIRGKSFFHTLPTIEKPHKQYFEEDLPGILTKLSASFRAIKHLHDNGFCHGDIRNDHIMVEADTGEYRWIDFDLKQDVSDFDIWSLGNIISYAVGHGLKTFRAIMKSDDFSDDVKNSLLAADGSAFYNYRLMNFSKIYPYVPPRLSLILRHFTSDPIGFYESIDEFCDSYDEMLHQEFL